MSAETAASVELIGVQGIPEIQVGDDLAGIIVAAAAGTGLTLCDGDVVVVAQKVVSKAEGAVRRLRDVVAGDEAIEIARHNGGDPRMVQVVLDESATVIRRERVLIVETHHGFICANAGVDHSNVPGGDVVTLLPRDVDASAATLCSAIREKTGAGVGVVVSDTFGRPWRMGIVNVALGVAGIPALIDYRGTRDDCGEPLTATVVAAADELAAAAELIMGKTNRLPVVIVRGYVPGAGSGVGRDLLRDAAEDLFR